jgi:hypothetical protein
MKQAYAVVWSENGSVTSGRLDSLGDRFELTGRGQHLSIPFAELRSASIARGASDRLHGLPVLELARDGRPPVRIASLEGTGALHELFAKVERVGVAVAPTENAA